MNIELIIFLVIWLVSTEFIFFRVMRGTSRANNFFSKKIISIILGILISFILFGLPWTFALDGVVRGKPLGNMAYVWYYGTIIIIGGFFLINYIIHKKLEKRAGEKENE